jgi:hypothetical protein
MRKDWTEVLRWIGGTPVARSHASAPKFPDSAAFQHGESDFMLRPRVPWPEGSGLARARVSGGDGVAADADVEGR